MQTDQKHGKMLTVKDGYLVCPRCRTNGRVMKIDQSTFAINAVAFCRTCKWEGFVNIEKGQCFKSQSQ
ncbi:MAG: hypothetical protein IJO56_05855 [Oscillospiraceae bacterium]|nr:hypothetical protein [Oscillospiraceae bacterium]